MSRSQMGITRRRVVQAGLACAVLAAGSETAGWSRSFAGAESTADISREEAVARLLEVYQSQLEAYETAVADGTVYDGVHYFGEAYEDANVAAGGRLCYDQRTFWCGSFIWWMFNQAGLNAAYCGGEALSEGRQIADWYRKNGVYSPSLVGAQPGDLVFFTYPGAYSGTDIGHIGMCAGVLTNGILVIDGNVAGIRAIPFAYDSPLVRGYARVELPDMQNAGEVESDSLEALLPARIPESTLEVLVDNSYVTASVIENNLATETPSLGLLLTNKTDRRIGLSCNRASVNGWMANPGFLQVLAPEETAYVQLGWDWYTLGLMGIDSIASLDLSFDVWDQDDLLSGALAASTVKLDIEGTAATEARQSGEVLFDDKTLSVSIDGFGQNENGAWVSFYAKNNGAEPKTFDFVNTSVNHVAHGEMFALTVNPGCVGRLGPCWYRATLDTYGLSDVTSAGFAVRTREGDEQTFTYHPLGKESDIDHKLDISSLQRLDDDGSFAAAWVSTQRDLLGQAMTLYIQNLGTDPIRFTVTSAEASGSPLNVWSTVVVWPGESGYAFPSFYDTSLAEAGIESLADFTLNYEVVDYATSGGRSSFQGSFRSTM